MELTALPIMQPNKKKILEVVLFLIELAQSEHVQITQYEIVKSIFIADFFHLKKYGRPVSFDNYAAMPFGPVPSEAYDMLKPAYDGSDISDKWPLWERSKYPQGGPRAYAFHDISRPPNKRKISQTDILELIEAFHLVKRLGFAGVYDWTHDLPAYKDAWSSRDNRRSMPMEYSLLVEGNDKELVTELAHASRFM